MNSVLAASSSTSVANFAVPNTIYMAWLGEFGSIGKQWMSWELNKTQLEGLGFKVQTFDNDSYDEENVLGAKNAFLSGIWSLTYNKRIHGLYMMGHGSTTGIACEEVHSFCDGPEWSVDYDGISDTEEIEQTMQNPGTRNITTIGDALNYRLGALIIHACNGKGSTGESNLVTSEADGGIFAGYTGTYNPMPFNEELELNLSSLLEYWNEIVDVENWDDIEPIAKNWGRKITPGTPQNPGIGGSYNFTIGGKQETGTFEYQRQVNLVWAPILIPVE